MQTSSMELLRLIEARSVVAAERGRQVHQAGPFRALLDPTTALVWLNYAVPTASLDDLDEVERGLGELRRVFAAAGRQPRFEFTAALWPTLPGLLEAAGLRLQGSHPLMLCSPAELRPFAATGVTVELLRPDQPAAELIAYQEVQAAGFADDLAAADLPADDESMAGLRRQLVDEGALAALRRQLASGDLQAALARLDGQPAGVGCLQPVGVVAELAGVATLPYLRRRGVAATLSSALTADHFARGGQVAWLSAGGEAAAATYRKLGYKSVGARLSYLAEA